MQNTRHNDGRTQSLLSDMHISFHNLVHLVRFTLLEVKQ